MFKLDNGGVVSTENIVKVGVEPLREISQAFILLMTWHSGIIVARYGKRLYQLSPADQR